MRTSTGGRSVGPAWWPTLAVAVAAAAAIVLGVVAMRGPVLVPALLGYVVGAIVGVVLLVIYRAVKASRNGPHFRANPLLDRLTFGLSVTGGLAGLWCAFLLATELAK